MRSSMNGQPAKKLSELLIQAKPALEAELLQKPILTDGAITLFFSFSDGLQRATVVHFTGQHLDEVWKKLADWQQRKLKTSPQVRWLRIDWVTETRAMTWADCQIEMQNVKRNYFRYGIALDTQLRRAFLEQELNANAMLYLGARQPKAALNKKNFLNYGVRRYGKHFSLPSPKDQVLLFTTRAILVQPGQPHELLHDYSGGKEGRNTGRRVIEKLDPEQVTSLIQQSSQFLADQVNAEGRFTYGIHPCFDREIKAYNTLRHASTTYAMLEAWEVTKSSDLKSSIDRSIQHLTNKLIRQYALHSGELVAYLQDSNNEIKLGGNGVCLLALVKYTELTNDNQHLPLMEQLALGIQRMQNPQNGQLCHVLNADDLSIKEEFRIIYYDGEAAFGLMRLYGLTKDERWLDTVEKAFEYFIEKEHWKIHDHWLSYCVNELTLYRPEERYYQFGIKNVAGHLDFVIGRITTFPSLLELMMAAHKMITRLEASNQHRHLLEQIDLKKFYRALEARAHYLLNGFFWPEFAIYFQNPQRIMGSFFIRHHSFRVRIDDVEHYLSGYVAYLMYYLNSDPERQYEQKFHEKTYISEDKNKEIAALFLNQDIGENLTGIEHSALGRASLFIEELGINPLIVTVGYRPYLQHNVAKVLSEKRYHPSTQVLGLYDFIQGFQTSPWAQNDRKDDLPPALDPDFLEFAPVPVKGFKDIRYLNSEGRLFAYKVYSKSHGKIMHVNYFEHGKKVAADIYHATGLKSSHRIYDPDSKQKTHEIYYNPWGVPLFFQVFENSYTHAADQKSLSTGFHLLPAIMACEKNDSLNIEKSVQTSTSAIGMEALKLIVEHSRYLGDSSDFTHFSLTRLAATIDKREILLLCDKNKTTFKPAANLRDNKKNQILNKKIRIIGAVHSTHYQGNEKNNNLKTHYRSLLQSQKKADKIIVLTESQRQDIQQRFPDEEIATIPHALTITSESLSKESYQPNLKSKKIVYVARLSPEKDHLLALEIFKKLAHNTPNATLHFYGNGSERGKIQEKIQQLNLEKSVKLEGYCANLADIYEEACCAILTSKMEGFSLSLLDAMAFKCPTVAFDINYGPRDLILHGETGYLVPYGEKDLFAYYLTEILNNPILAKRLGNQAYERFSDNFSYKRTAESWQKTITDIFQ